MQRAEAHTALFAQPVGFRRHSGMFLEKAAEKGGVREIQVVGYLLDGHLRGTQLGLGIENHRLGLLLPSDRRNHLILTEYYSDENLFPAEKTSAYY